MFNHFGWGFSNKIVETWVSFVSYLFSVVRALLLFWPLFSYIECWKCCGNMMTVCRGLRFSSPLRKRNTEAVNLLLLKIPSQCDQRQQKNHNIFLNLTIANGKFIRFGLSIAVGRQHAGWAIWVVVVNKTNVKRATLTVLVPQRHRNDSCHTPGAM